MYRRHARGKRKKKSLPLGSEGRDSCGVRADSRVLSAAARFMCPDRNFCPDTMVTLWCPEHSGLTSAQSEHLVEPRERQGARAEAFADAEFNARLWCPELEVRTDRVKEALPQSSSGPIISSSPERGMPYPNVSLGAQFVAHIGDAELAALLHPQPHLCEAVCNGAATTPRSSASGAATKRQMTLQNCKEETCEVCSSRTRLICEQCEHRRMHALRVRACERACVHPCVRALLCTNCLVQCRVVRLVMPTHEHRDAWLCVLHATQLPT